MANVLIVDDDRDFREALADYVSDQGFSVSCVASLQEARAEIAKIPPTIVLIDLRLPDGDGLELLDELEDMGTEVLLVTGYPSVESAVTGLRKDATDYLTKPVDLERLHACLMRAKVKGLHNPLPPHEGDRFGSFIGRSPAMREVYQLLERVAPSGATVFVYGESGTGKELAARAVHELSGRAGPLLALNCGAVPENLIGNELFGHERGGFTGASRQHKGYFERAAGGTLFLDEITEMPLDLQASLLRVLETSTITRIGGSHEISVNVRLVAATNRDPRQALQEGRLREDLFFRLMVFPVKLPPLRARKGDIVLLAQHFLRLLRKEHGVAKRLTADAEAALMTNQWPGNVRELKNVLHRAYLLSQDEISAQHITGSLELQSQSLSANAGALVGTSLEEVERNVITATLDQFEGDKQLAAKSLGICLKTLYNKINRYGIEASSTSSSNCVE